MGKSIFIGFLLILALAFSGVSEARESQPRKKAELKEIVIRSNLHCEKCVKKIEENLSFEKGVKALKVSLGENTITISFDPAKTSSEALTDAVRKLGYSAAVIK